MDFQRFPLALFFKKTLVLCAFAIIIVAYGDKSSGGTDTRVASSEKMRPFAEFLNEVSERRRRVVYIPQHRSVVDGALVGLVHVGSGSLSLKRRDLVVVDRLPISISRLYSSDGEVEGDFGNSRWSLSVNEYIEIGANGDATYRDGSGSHRSLILDQDEYKFSVPIPTDIQSIRRFGRTQIDILLSDGTTKHFVGTSSENRLWLNKVSDKFGNSKSYVRDANSLLTTITTTGARVVTIQRDDQGRIKSIIDGDLREVAYQYDDQGRLERAIDIGDFSWRYEYSDDQLKRAFAPSQILDLDIAYYADRRVRSVAAHGLVTEYEYDRVSESWSGLSVVLVSGGGFRATSLGQNKLGITVAVKPEGGPEARLELDSRNRPHRHLVGEALSATFEYDDAGRLFSRIYADDSLPQYHYKYTPGGALYRIEDESGSAHLTVGMTREGHTDVSDIGNLTRYKLSNAGDLTFYERQGHPYSIDHNAVGQIRSIVDGKGRESTLVHYPSGELDSIFYPDGTVHSFDYNDVGLRSGGDYSDGHSAVYDYSPDGSLISYTLSQDDEVIRHVEYEAPNGHLLETLVGGDFSYGFSYDDAGNLLHVNWRRGSLTFGYDSQGRFESIRDALGEQWLYEYKADEPDLLLQFDRFTHVGLSGRIDSGDSHVGLSEMLYDRVIESGYGPLAINVSTGKFESVGIYGTAIPGYTQSTSLARSRLVDAQNGSPTVTEGGLPIMDMFAAPSNIAFLPGEFWSVNCNICPPDNPHSVDPNRAADGVGLGEISAALERCPFVYQGPGGDGGGGGNDCANQTGIDNKALSWSNAIRVREPFERGVIIACSNSSLTLRAESVSPDEDPCRAPVPITQNDVAGAHTHPYFRNATEAAGCKGIPLNEWTQALVNAQNIANKWPSTGPQSDETWVSSTEKDLYTRKSVNKKLMATTPSNLDPRNVN